MSYYDIDEKYNEEPSIAPPSYDDSVSVSIAPPSFELTVEREQLALERLQLAEDRARLIEATKELARLRSELEERERLLTLRLPSMPADVPAYNLSKVPEFWEYLRSAVHPFYGLSGKFIVPSSYQKGILSWFPTIPKYVCTYVIRYTHSVTNDSMSMNTRIYVVTSKQVYRVSMSLNGTDYSRPLYDPTIEYVFDQPLLEHQASMMTAYASSPFQYFENEPRFGTELIQRMEQQFWALVHTIPGQKP